MNDRATEDRHDDPFAALRAHRGNASRRQLSRYALGELDAAETTEVERSLAACAHCRDLVAQERAEVVDRFRPVPPRILEVERRVTAPKPRTWGRLLPRVWPVPALALAVVAVWLTVPETTNTTRQKGAAPPSETGSMKAIQYAKEPIAIAVKRGEQLVVRKARVEEVALKVGDRVRLKVPAAFPWVRVEANDAAEDPLFEGWRPADGWLPMALLLTDTEPTRLTIQTCASKSVLSCETWIVPLQALP